jgi:hypothetical protein
MFISSDSRTGRFTWLKAAWLRTAVFVVMIVLGVLLTSGTTVAQAPIPYANNLRISQVYGAGGNSGATYTHDYIEIFNSSGQVISLNGLSLQYASPTGTGNFGASANQLTALPSVLLQPGQYYLVQQAGGTNGVPLPVTPDFIPSTLITMGATGGKVVLVTGTNTLGCNGSSALCTEEQLSRIIDLVGYGNANFYEGSVAPAPSTTNAIFRNAVGCIDTNNNGADFTANPAAPRNSSSPLNTCGSYNTIDLDGTITSTEWERGLLGSVNSSTFGITWDDDFWYFGVKGGFSNTDFFMVGIDTDPDNETSNTGGTAARCGATFPTENKPDYILVNRQNSYIRESWGWNGSAWDQGSFNPAEPGDYDFSGGGGDYEVKLRKSTVFASNEDSSPVGFYLWLSNGSCEFFNAWPPENPNGYIAGSRFLYSHIRYNTTDANRTPDTFGNRVAWVANTLSTNSTTYNFFGEDDVTDGNPWLRLTTTASGSGGASCTVRAKMVGNNSFNNPPFEGVNRYVDFTLTNCTNLEVDVQMRYETGELNGVNEANTTFYRCPTLPCAASWSAVSTGTGTYTRNAANNNLLLTNVPQTQFSFWTIGDSNTPTAVSLQSFTAANNATPFVLLALFALLVGGTAVVRRKIANGQ